MQTNDSDDYKPESMLGLVIALIIILTPVALIVYDHYSQPVQQLALSEEH